LRKGTLFFTIFLVINLSIQSQSLNSRIDDVIKEHKNLNLAKLEEQLTDIQPLKLKQFFSYELAFLKTGERVNASKLDLRRLKGRSYYVGEYLLADFLKRGEDANDSLVLSKYKDALTRAVANKDSMVINEVLNRINAQLFLNGNELDVYDRYIKRYEESAQDSTDIFYVFFNKIRFEFMKHEKTPKSIDSLKVEKLFAQAQSFAFNSYLKANLNSYKSIFYSACFNNQELASQFNQMAIDDLKGIPYHYAQYVVSGIEFNNAIILYEEGKFDEAIPIFKRVLKTEKELVYRMHGYDWLHKCYDSIGDYGNAYRYFKKVGEVKDSLSLLEHAREIKAIEAQYNFAEKERELQQLANEKNRVQTNFNTLVPFFGIALVLVLVALYLYRKYRNRSELLQEEKDETLKRIRQLKKIVVKNHIILKDKTKVYIADLVYIKAEDHYLKLFLSNEKHHLVRGKIKNIKQQLPPNFIQCHRSYIVNANFIKQANHDSLMMIGGDNVPLSRTYKDKF